MKKHFILTFLCFAALAACDKTVTKPDARQISILADIGETGTKVAYSGNAATFEAGDELSLYAWTGNADAVPATRVVDGVKHSLGTDGKWTPETPTLWADMVSPHYFLGISPARTVSDFTADSYTLDPADYAASDLLFAAEFSGLKAQEKPVSLTFDHALARLDIELTFRNQWTDTPTVASVKVTAKKTATVNYLEKTLTATGTASAVALGKQKNAAWSGLQIPQGGLRTLTIRIDGKDYKYTHPTDIPLVSGKFTTVRLFVGRDKIELASDITISDWTAGASINGGEAVDED